MVDSWKETMSSTASDEKLVEILDTFKTLLQSIHYRSITYHYKLIGDSQECLSTLLGIDDVHFHCILSLCGLYDIKKQQHNIFDMQIFDP